MLNSARVWKKFCTFALNLNGRIMAIENELNARLQHAVIGQGTATTSVPKKGEVIFNQDLKNFKVGNGEDPYSDLPNFFTTETWILVLEDGNTENRKMLISR